MANESYNIYTAKNDLTENKLEEILRGGSLLVSSDNRATRLSFCFARDVRNRLKEKIIVGLTQKPVINSLTALTTILSNYLGRKLCIYNFH